MIYRSAILAALALSVWSRGSASAQNQTDASTSAVGSGADRAESNPPALPSITAARRGADLRIDGFLDDAAWLDAPRATGFVQGEPIEGAPAHERTEVSVVYDATAIYIGVRMFESNPDDIGAQLVRRDEQGQYDYFEVSLDPNNDRRTGYVFRVSAAGVQRDVYLYDDVREDDNWDAVWQSGVQRDSLGWTAEMRIPLSQLRYDPSDRVQDWGVNFTRRRLVDNERSYFALQSRERHGVVSVFGRLEGLTIPRGARRIEARPYVLSSAHTAPAEPGNPFFDGSQMGVQTGLDLRYGIGSAFTVDLTVNPDFGQVEVDPAVINLSAFETFFPEKRPFFVEDAQVLDFTLSGRSDRLFYSRRVGRAPHGGASSDFDFEDVPAQTTILSAAKLTGRTANGLSVGVLAALTGKETGSAFDAENDVTETFTVEPRSQYGVARVQQDFRNGATQIGAIVTGVNRELPADGTFDFLPSNAYSFGIDFEHSWGGIGSRDWALQGYAAGSRVDGSEDALLRIQRSSNHYFQRPDATRFALDSTATSMSGIAWRVQFERRSARHWTGGVWLSESTPGFEINDLGFSRSSERLDGGARLSYRETRPGSLFRSYRINFFTFHNWRHEALDDAFSLSSWARARKSGALVISTDFEFLNYWSVDVRGSFSPRNLSDGATRGGPLMTNPAGASINVSMQTDRRARLFLEPKVEYRTEAQGAGRQFETGMRMTIRPSPSWEVQFEPQFTSERTGAQYVTSTDDPAYDPTYGRRYLFGDLERRSFSMETRLDVAFTRLLTLQLFAQPLISSGDYVAYKQLAQAETFDFDTFEEGAVATVNDEATCTSGRTCLDGETRLIDFDGDGSTDLTFGERDFNVRSLRLNAVLRWEYRPGSTVFLVWQQGRRQRLVDGSFDLGRDFSDLFGLDSDNTFILKFNYWIGL